MSSLTEYHNPNGGKKWRLTPKGIEVEGEGHIRTNGEPLSIEYLWEDFGEHIQHACYELDVPVEIPSAMICVESGRKEGSLRFDPRSDRKEPGYESDEETPHRRSPGLMQTLLSTAQRMNKRYDLFDDEEVTTDLLFDPFYSILCGTAYIANQIERYGEDPPLICASYNAGSVRETDDNEWKLMTYNEEHIERYIKFFNDFHYAVREDVIEVPDNLKFATPE